jgi:hypothetical protein
MRSASVDTSCALVIWVAMKPLLQGP